MSTFYDIKFLSANRKFVADLPALRKPPTAAAPLNLSRISNPIIGNTLRPKINQVDPHLLAEKISVATDNLALPEIKAHAPAPKVGRSYKTAAAVLAGTAAFLAPAVAFAGGPLSGLLGFSAGVYIAGAAMFFGPLVLALYFARTLYLNPRFGGRPGDPTGKRLITKLAIPALATVSTWGGALLASTFAASLLGFSSSTFLFGLAGIAGTYVGAKLLISSIRLIMDRISGKRKTVEKLSLKNRLFTNFLTYNAQFAYALYTSTRALTFVSMAYGVLGRGLINLINLSFSPLAPLIGAGLGLLYGLYYRRPVAQIVNPHQAPQKRLWNLPVAAACVAGGAALGTTLAAIGYNPFLNLIFAAALFTVEMHDILHGWKTLGGARKVEEDVPRLYSDLEIWRAARARTGEFSTLLKPSFNNDVVPIIWAKVHVREGANWNINQVNSQDYSNPTQIAGIWRLFHSIEGNLQSYRDWIRAAVADVRKATDPENPKHRELALDATASIFNRLAAAYDTPSPDNNFNLPAEGNFAHLGIDGFGDHTFSDPAADHHYHYVWKLILTKANDYRQKAREIAAGTTNPIVARAQLEELKHDMLEEIDALYRKFNVHYDMFLSSFASNILPEILITKIEQLDAFNALTRDFITGISILRRNPDNSDVYMEIIPSNVVKDLKPDPEYKEVWNFDSRDREDNRFHWRERRVHEIGESHSDIAFIDMSDHFRRHKDDLAYYPTANVHAVPVLAADEFYDVVFKNGSRLRCFGDGRQARITSKSGAEVPASADNIFWVAGTPAPTKELEEATDHGYGYSYDFYLKEPFAPRFYFFFQTPYQSLSDAEQLDLIVSDLLAYLKEDRQTPFAFYQFKIPEKLNLPYDPDMPDRPSDQLLQVAQGTTWFMLRATKTENGRQRTLYIPYGLRKESYDLYPNESAHEGHGWDSIDENVPVRLVERGKSVDPADPPCPYERALVFTYKDGSRGDPSFSNDPAGGIYKRYPLHMGNPTEYEGGEARIDLGRGKRGVMPMIKFVFLKRYDEGPNKGKIILGNDTISDEAWNAFIKKPISQEAWKKMLEAFHAKLHYANDPAQIPYVDENDRVHIPQGQGFEIPAGLTVDANRTVDIFAYREFRMRLMRETLYERFLPLENFAKYWDPETIK